MALCDWQKISSGRTKAKAIFRSWGGIYWGQVNFVFSHIHFTWSLVSNTFIMSEQQSHNSPWPGPEYWFPELSWCIHAIVMLHGTVGGSRHGWYCQNKSPGFILCPRNLKQTTEKYLFKGALRSYGRRILIICLYVADPATYLVSNSVLEALFSSRTADLLNYE